MPSQESVSGDQRRPPRPHLGHPPAPEPEQQLPCPRCSSTNTKFCYYNNYNLSQPRYYCKSCRRYWTRGGTLRNVPVGGATRSAHKNPNNKRSRTSDGRKVTDASFSSPSSVSGYDPLPVDPITQVPSSASGVNLNEKVPEAAAAEGGYAAATSFLNLSNGGGFFGLGGYGAGFREIGFGVGSGSGVWQMEDGGNINMWQVGGGVEGGMGDGGCYGWPDLAISTPGEALK